VVIRGVAIVNEAACAASDLHCWRIKVNILCLLISFPHPRSFVKPRPVSLT